MERESFISNLIGHGLYDELKSHSFLIVGVGTVLLIVLFLCGCRYGMALGF
jgi:hypothetical protein